MDMARVIRKKGVDEENIPSQSTETASRPKMRKPSPTVSVMGLLLLLALGTAGYFYYQYSHMAQVAEATEIKALVNKVGKVVALPEGEVPTLATVTNKEKLDNQPFFQKAANGDKILIYTAAGQVVLYRPSTGKVIDMTTVSITPEIVPQETVETSELAPVIPETPVTEVLPEKTPEVDLVSVPATIALYNGSTKVGVTGTFETTLSEQFPMVTITAKEKAAKSDYQGNLIIDLSGTHAELAQKLAESIGGTIGTLSADETKPAADILVIVGNKQ